MLTAVTRIGVWIKGTLWHKYDTRLPIFWKIHKTMPKP